MPDCVDIQYTKIIRYQQKELLTNWLGRGISLPYSVKNLGKCQRIPTREWDRSERSESWEIDKIHTYPPACIIQHWIGDGSCQCKLCSLIYYFYCALIDTHMRPIMRRKLQLRQLPTTIVCQKCGKLLHSLVSHSVSRLVGGCPDKYVWEKVKSDLACFLPCPPTFRSGLNAFSLCRSKWVSGTSFSTLCN